MGMIVFFRMIGSRKSRYIKPMILGGLAFFLFFEGTYSFLFGKVLNFSFIGMANIPAKILAIILAIMAWDARQTG